MAAYVLVLDPEDAFAVADGAGSFRLADLPAGRQTVHVWSEKGGEKELTVDVGAEGAAPLEVVLDASSYRPDAPQEQVRQGLSTGDPGCRPLLRRGTAPAWRPASSRAPPCVIVVTVGLSVALASGKAEAVARERIRGELLRVPALFAGWRDSQMSARRGQVRAVAEQPGTKALPGRRGRRARRPRTTPPSSSRAPWARPPSSCSTRTAA